LDAHLVAVGSGQHVFASCAPGTDLREEDYLEVLWQCQVGVAVSLHATEVCRRPPSPARHLVMQSHVPDASTGALSLFSHARFAFFGLLGELEHRVMTIHLLVAFYSAQYGTESSTITPCVSIADLQPD
jgi:hypothetical protein